MSTVQIRRLSTCYSKRTSSSQPTPSKRSNSKSEPKISTPITICDSSPSLLSSSFNDQVLQNSDCFLEVASGETSNDTPKYDEIISDDDDVPTQVPDNDCNLNLNECFSVGEEPTVIVQKESEEPIKNSSTCQLPTFSKYQMDLIYRSDPHQKSFATTLKNIPLTSAKQSATRDSIWTHVGEKVVIIADSYIRFIKHYNREYQAQLDMLTIKKDLVFGEIHAIDTTLIPESVPKDMQKYWQNLEIVDDENNHFVVPFLPRLLSDTPEHVIPMIHYMSAINRSKPPIGSIVSIPFAKETRKKSNTVKYKPMPVEWTMFLIIDYFDNGSTNNFETIAGMLVEKNRSSCTICPLDIQGPNLISMWDFGRNRRRKKH
ncbi:hypothetical protein GEMRC1_001720 [Eukaryota sp. GEM-RC1]